jgi:hypothetical protein
MRNRRNKAKDRSEAFLAWTKRSALPLPVSHEEPLGDEVQAALDRMLEGKRFVFLGEPDHFIIEKYLFRLVLMQYLFQRGWRHAAMETGRSIGWHVDRYLETGDASLLTMAGAEPPNPMDLAIHDKTLEFIDAHENSFHEQLRQISESRAQGTTRLRYSVAAEKRPRVNQDPRGNRRWWAQREHFLMQSLDAIVDGLSGDEKLILLGHNVHLSKDAANLHFHPQFSNFWGLRSWLGAWGYRMYFKLAGWPTKMGDSVGAHMHRRFPGQVLSIWMLYGQGSLMTPKGPRNVRLRSDTVESLLAQVGDRFLLPLNDVDPQAKAILSHANIRSAGGEYASADLTAQADAIYFAREVHVE